jgi:AraC-like DNA-binding protein
MQKQDKIPFSTYGASGGATLISPRVHGNSMEILEVTSGKTKLEIGTEIFEVSAGSFVYVPPTLVFRMEAASEHASVRGIIFDSTILTDNMDNFENEILYMFFLQSQNMINVFDPSHPIYETLKECMRSIYEESIAKDVCYKLPIRANIYLMMSSLLRHYCGSRDEYDKIIYHNVLRLRPIIEYIFNNFIKKIYVEELADMINVSPDYFTRMFKDSIGKTPIDYINALRVNRALKLLFQTEIPVSEVAEATGFSNPNYFNKTFKLYMNTSPLAYRKSARS